MRVSARWIRELPLPASCFSTVGLALVVHVIPIPVTASAADRFLYVPLIGLCMLLTPGPRAASELLIQGGSRWQRARFWLHSPGVLTHRPQLYADDVAFWGAALEGLSPSRLGRPQPARSALRRGWDGRGGADCAERRSGLGAQRSAKLRRSAASSGQSAPRRSSTGRSIVAAPDSTERDAIALARSQVCAERELDALATLIGRAAALSERARRWKRAPAAHRRSCRTSTPLVRPADASGWEAVAKQT
jgi:hypothetical protein